MNPKQDREFWMDFAASEFHTGTLSDATIYHDEPPHTDGYLRLNLQIVNPHKEVLFEEMIVALTRITTLLSGDKIQPYSEGLVLDYAKLILKKTEKLKDES